MVIISIKLIHDSSHRYGIPIKIYKFLNLWYTACEPSGIMQSLDVTAAKLTYDSKVQIVQQHPHCIVTDMHREYRPTYEGLLTQRMNKSLKTLDH